MKTFSDYLDYAATVHKKHPGFKVFKSNALPEPAVFEEKLALDYQDGHGIYTVGYIVNNKNTYEQYYFRCETSFSLYFDTILSPVYTLNWPEKDLQITHATAMGAMVFDFYNATEAAFTSFVESISAGITSSDINVVEQWALDGYRRMPLFG